MKRGDNGADARQAGTGTLGRIRSRDMKSGRVRSGAETRQNRLRADVRSAATEPLAPLLKPYFICFLVRLFFWLFVRLHMEGEPQIV